MTGGTRAVLTRGTKIPLESFLASSGDAT